MSKFTEGPWIPSLMKQGQKPCGYRVIANGYQLAHCYMYGETASIKETEANARLIAESPTMYNLLKLAQVKVFMVEGESKLYREIQDLILRIEPISKADGEVDHG